MLKYCSVPVYLPWLRTSSNTGQFHAQRHRVCDGAISCPDDWSSDKSIHKYSTAVRVRLKLRDACGVDLRWTFFNWGFRGLSFESHMAEQGKNDDLHLVQGKSIANLRNRRHGISFRASRSAGQVEDVRMPSGLPGKSATRNRHLEFLRIWNGHFLQASALV